MIFKKAAEPHREKPEHLKTGESGEEMAVNFLRAAGYGVIGRNVRYPWGEIDIIAKKHDEIIFVEVRTRRAGWMMPPELTVGPNKLRRLVRAARTWTEQKRYMGFWRIDLIAITINGDCEPAFEHIESITEGIL